MKGKVERYKGLSAKFSLQALAKTTQLDNAVKKIEQQYFLKHANSPSVIHLTMKGKNHAKAVLRALNISL